MLVVHGIGEPEPRETRGSVVEGLKLAYPAASFVEVPLGALLTAAYSDRGNQLDARAALRNPANLLGTFRRLDPDRIAERWIAVSVAKRTPQASSKERRRNHDSRA